MLAVVASASVARGETTSAAPPTISGKVKKNGLLSWPVSRTRIAAKVMATEPSTMNLALPSDSAGTRSWTTRTKNPARASSTRMAAWLSFHRPVTATIVVVDRRKIQATTRTTRSKASGETVVVDRSRVRKRSAGWGSVGSRTTRRPPSDGTPSRSRRRSVRRAAPMSARFAITARAMSTRTAWTIVTRTLLPGPDASPRVGTHLSPVSASRHRRGGVWGCALEPGPGKRGDPPVRGRGDGDA